MICKILGLFANTLTADDKYSLLKRENLTEPIQMQLSNKQKNFFRFFFLVHFLNLDQILNILKKKITLLGHVLPKLRTGKDVVR